MKSKTLAIAFATTLLTAQSGHLFAENNKPSKKEKIAAGKGAALFTSGAIAGAAVGGPIGAILGAMGGALIGEDLQQGAQDAEARNRSEQELAAFKLTLQEQEAKIADLEQSSAQTLEFQVLFTTGSDTLNHSDQQRLISLANYLKTNPELSVRLEGYADPRGTDDSNTSLSEERAIAVENALTSLGVERNRISYTAHGASLSLAAPGDYEAYALERRVNIEVLNEEATVAAN